MVVNIMIGPPCAGKSTKAREMLKQNPRLTRVNRDELRQMMLGSMVINNGYVEQAINEITKMHVQRCMWADCDVVIDATHCKPSYITNIKNMVPVAGPTGVKPNVTFKYVVCDVPFWKQRWRNFWRWCKTGVWIPREASVIMDRNFRNTLEQIRADKV